MCERTNSKNTFQPWHVAVDFSTAAVSAAEPCKCEQVCSSNNLNLLGGSTAMCGQAFKLYEAPIR